MAGDVVDPRKNQGDWKAKHNRDDGESLAPVGYFERRKDLRHDLNEQPTYDCVRDGDGVNSPSL